METAFIDIVKKLVAEQGKETLLSQSKCKSFLADYTKGEYKKECRLLLQVLESGCQNAIMNASDIGSTQSKIVKQLVEAVVEIVDLLILVLRESAESVNRNDTGLTHLLDGDQKRNHDSVNQVTDHKGNLNNNSINSENTNISSILRYDGLYYREEGFIDMTTYLLRFFPNGKVISVTVSGRYSKTILSWFNEGYNGTDDSVGRYSIKGKNISFTTTSSYGSVDYTGIIMDDGLVIDSHSNINDYRAKNNKYLFKKI